MKKSKLTIIKSSLVMAIILTGTVLFAQPGGGGGQGLGGNPPGTGAPIDGGASILLLGIAGYAHKKLKAKAPSEAKKA